MEQQVKLTKACWGLRKGTKGTLKQYNEFIKLYAIELKALKRHKAGHDCTLKGCPPAVPSGHGLWLRKDEFELIEKN
jgi:hypothetical protein